MPDLTGLTSREIESVERIVKDGLKHSINPIGLSDYGEPDGTYLLFEEKTGKWSKEVAEPHVPKIIVSSTEDLLSFCRGKEKTGAAIYYDRTGATGVFIDNRGRRNIARMLFPKSRAFHKLQTFNETANLKQRPFWNLLRTVWKKCVSPDFIYVVQTMRWSDASDSEASLKMGTESLSNSIKQSIRSEAAIPEELTFSLPVFDLDEIREKTYDVVVAIDVNLQARGFSLLPVSDDMERAEFKALQDLTAKIRTQKEIPTVFGSFSANVAEPF